MTMIKLEFQKNILNIEKIRNIFTEYDRGVLFWELVDKGKIVHLYFHKPWFYINNLMPI